MSLVNSSLDSVQERALIFSEIDEINATMKNMQAACKIIHSKYTLAITLRALYERYKRYISNNKKYHGNNIFSFSEEEKIVGMIEAWSLLNHGLTKRMLFIGIKSIKRI